MDSQIKHFSHTYEEISKIPSPISAKILPGLHNNLCIHTLWSSQDFVKSEKKIFSRDYLIEKEKLEVLSSGISCDISSVHLCAFNKSGKRRAILRGNKSSEGEKLYLEIWNELKKEATFDMTKRNEHGKICENDHFKCFEWSSDDKILLYVAEEKQPKCISFFKENSILNKDLIKGEEYLFREEWGEACVGVHHTVLCMLEIQTGLIEVLPTNKIGSKISFGQAKWGPNDESIVFVGWEESPYRLGVWACRNRRSALYMMNLKNKELECITPGNNICVRSPRFSPCFNTLIYFENAMGGPHFKGAKLQKYDMNRKKCSTVVDLVENATGDDFPGIYSDKLPLRCWSENGKYVYFSTMWRSNMAIICVNINDGHVQKIEFDGSFGAASVLDVQYDIIIAVMSSPNIEPCLVVGHIKEENKAIIEWKYLDANTPVKHSDIRWNISRLTPALINKYYSNLDYDILVISPTEEQKKCPLIVSPHGGPHSCYIAEFLFRTIGFVKLGYILCLVNYRGSAGFGENNIRSLLGNIGTQDVSDVQEAVVYAKNGCNFDVSDVFIFGGSHGGFIGSHLCGQYPEFYNAAVLLNPSFDVSDKISVSDIPDWNWVESGFGDNFDLSTVIKPDQLQIMWEKSPIKYVENVCTPTLLLLGKNDLRVPMSQGLKYYKLLKANNVPVRVCMYDDNHKLMKTQHDGDVFMQSIIWFNKHLSF